MLNCKRATALMSRAEDQKLSWHQNLQLKLHTLMCSGCSNYRKQLHFIKKTMQQYSGR
ncbi:MAG TPA: zf-HC2 domain-containing protein [Gammaproteobacteria bacterium]|nr:zf-HC2 domain-containing protein [Gammaproteobacteria bacterium]